MPNPILRLDPRLPIVWQNPDSVQIGVSPPRCVVPDIDDRVLPLLHALHTGISVAGAKLMGSEAGLSAAEVTTVLQLLGPALTHQQPSSPVAITLRGELAHITRFATTLAHAGHRVNITEDAQEIPQETSEGEVVLVGNFVINPAHYRACLYADVIHTPVVFSDQLVRIGPRVIPGHTACLHCVWRNRVHREPHYVAIASQLWGATAATDTLELSALAAWHTRALLHEPEDGLVATLDALTGKATHSVELPSAECACGSLDVSQ